MFFARIVLVCTLALAVVPASAQSDRVFPLIATQKGEEITVALNERHFAFFTKQCAVYHEYADRCRADIVRYRRIVLWDLGDIGRKDAAMVTAMFGIITNEQRIIATRWQGIADGL